MATIQDYLNKILKSRYGRDVRQAIHDGIKTVNDIATGAQGSATSSANTAIAKANEAISASQSATEKAQEALQAAESAKLYSENAAAVTGVEIATEDRAGLMKGGENAVDEDGTLVLTRKVSGSAIVADGSHAGGLKFNKIYGKSVQETIPGNQLFDASVLANHVIATNGIVSYNGDGSFTVSGTGELTDNLIITYTYTHEETLRLLKTGMLNVNAIGDADVNPYFYIALFNADAVRLMEINGVYGFISKEITEEILATDGLFMKVGFCGLGGSTIVPGTIKPMIYQDGDGSWEPYVGAIPSPNPEYPQEIVSVGDSGSVEGKVVGKNLFYISHNKMILGNYSTITNGAITDTGCKFTVDVSSGSASAGVYTARGSNPLVVVGKTYTISCDVKVSTVDSFEMFRLGMTGTQKMAIYYASSFEAGVFKHCVFTVTATSDILVFYFNVVDYADGTDFDVEIANIQIETGSVATDYEPYTEQTLTFSTPNGLPGIEVTDASLANYTDADGKMWCCDEIDAERGVYVKRIDEVVLDGVNGELWDNGYISDGVNNRFQIIMSGTAYASYETTVSKHVNGLCDHFGYQRSVRIPDVGKFRIVRDSSSPTTVYILFNPPTNVIELENVDAWKAWLAENPITLYLPLATPIETPLTDEEIISAHNLKTYDGVTHIFTDGGDVDPAVEVEYGTSKVGALSLENSNLHVVNEVNGLKKIGDSKDNITTFTSEDALDNEEAPLAWTDVEVLTSGEKHSGLFSKISTMFKNIRYLYKMLGTEDISGIGDGTAKGAIKALNSNLSEFTSNTFFNLTGVKKGDVVDIPTNAQKPYAQLFIIFGDYFTVNSYDVCNVFEMVNANATTFTIPTLRKYDGTTITDARDLCILTLKRS